MLNVEGVQGLSCKSLAKVFVVRMDRLGISNLEQGMSNVEGEYIPVLIKKDENV
jgi:hypothetical protein